MSDPASKSGVSRPLSPHLSAYRLPLLPILSITHRITGVALASGTILVALWLGSLALGFKAYGAVAGFMASPLGILMLVGWSWALFYHGFNGVRHLLWDMGVGLSIGHAERSGWIVVVLSLLATLGLWLRIAFLG